MMFFFAFWIFFAIVTAAVASSKGRSVVGWLLLGALFSVFATIAVALLPSLKKPPIISDGEVATPETHVRCPDCKELVRRDAVVCKHCHATLVPQPFTPAPLGLARYKPLLIPGVIVAIIVGAAWMAGQDHNSTPKPQPATPAERTEAAKAQQEFEAKQAADKAQRKAKFDAERATIIAKAKSLTAQHKWRELADMDNDYAWANDAELDKMTSVARDKLAEIAMAKEKGQRRKQGVSIGMTKEEVLASSWGRPQHINKSVYASGVHEQWVYGGSNYIYFDGDVVTSIQTGP